MSKNAYQDFHGTLNRSFQLKIVTHRCLIPHEKREQVLSLLRKIFPDEDFSLVDTLEGRYEVTSENYFCLIEIENKVVGTAYFSYVCPVFLFYVGIIVLLVRSATGKLNLISITECFKSHSLTSVMS